MKKSYKHNDHSDQTCKGKGCGRPLKRRRVEEHSDELCYRCWIKSKLRMGKWNNHPGKQRRAGLL